MEIGPATTRAVVVEGFAGWELSSAHGRLRTTFLPAAGMVGSSFVCAEQELLGQRHGVTAYVRDRETMGIPLLHPWANRLDSDHCRLQAPDGRDVEIDLATSPLVHRDGNGLPIHGLVTGNADWEVLSVGVEADVAHLSTRLDLTRDPAFLSAFPFPHAVSVDVRLGPTSLAVTTAVEADGGVAVPVAFGWHPYLAVPGTPRADWQLTLPHLRHEELDPRGIPSGQFGSVPAGTRALGPDAWDDLFTLGPERTFSVGDTHVDVTVHMDGGYAWAQVYAPTDDAVVCFEPMTAPSNPFSAAAGGPRCAWVAPGASYRATFEITPRDTPR
ncbi:MAG: aldose 1-epimerase [Acidimicrobiia bacterium]|nr:aldose 1-epimerase [Acidimicrobiia bacterium]